MADDAVLDVDTDDAAAAPDGTVIVKKTQQQAPPSTEPPPTWDEIASDPHFQAAKPEKREQVLSQWGGELLDWGKSQGWSEPDFNDFQARVKDKITALHPSVLDNGASVGRQFSTNLATGLLAGAEGVTRLFGQGASALSDKLDELSGVPPPPAQPDQVDYSEQIADALQKAREHVASAPETAINPATANSTTGKILRGAAGVTSVVATGPLAIPTIVGQTYAEARDQAIKEAWTKGERDNDKLEQLGDDAGTSAVRDAAPVLAAYGAGGKIAGTVAAKLAPEASAVTKGIVGGATAAATNLAVSGTSRAVEGVIAAKAVDDDPTLTPEEKAIAKSKIPGFVGNLEQNVQDIGFGVHAGMEAGLHANAVAEAHQKIRNEAIIGLAQIDNNPALNDAQKTQLRAVILQHFDPETQEFIRSEYAAKKTAQPLRTEADATTPVAPAAAEAARRVADDAESTTLEKELEAKLSTIEAKMTPAEDEVPAPVEESKPTEPTFTEQTDEYGTVYSGEFPDNKSAVDWVARNRSSIQNPGIVTTDGKTIVRFRKPLEPTSHAQTEIQPEQTGDVQPTPTDAPERVDTEPEVPAPTSEETAPATAAAEAEVAAPPPAEEAAPAALVAEAAPPIEEVPAPPVIDPERKAAVDAWYGQSENYAKIADKATRFLATRPDVTTLDAADLASRFYEHLLRTTRDVDLSQPDKVAWNFFRDEAAKEKTQSSRIAASLDAPLIRGGATTFGDVQGTESGRTEEAGAVADADAAPETQGEATKEQAAPTRPDSILRSYRDSLPEEHQAIFDGLIARKEKMMTGQKVGGGRRKNADIEAELINGLREHYERHRGQSDNAAGGTERIEPEAETTPELGSRDAGQPAGTGPRRSEPPAEPEQPAVDQGLGADVPDVRQPAEDTGVSPYAGQDLESRRRGLLNRAYDRYTVEGALSRDEFRDIKSDLEDADTHEELDQLAERIGHQAAAKLADDVARPATTEQLLHIRNKFRFGNRPTDIFQAIAEDAKSSGDDGQALLAQAIALRLGNRTRVLLDSALHLNGSDGEYSHRADQIKLNPYVSDDEFRRNANHEGLHAVTLEKIYQWLSRDPRLSAEDRAAIERLNDLREQVLGFAPKEIRALADHYGGLEPTKDSLTAFSKLLQKDSGFADWYGLSSLPEFISEAFTNRRFQEFLKSHRADLALPESKPATLWDRFTNILSRLFGAKPGDVLHETIRSSMDLFKTPTKSRAEIAREVDGVPEVQPLFGESKRLTTLHKLSEPTPPEERRSGMHMLDNPDFSERVKAAVRDNLLYIPQGADKARDEATRIIDASPTLRDAIDRFQHDHSIDGGVRAQGLIDILKYLGQAEKMAEPGEAERIGNLATELTNQLLEQGTSGGRFIERLKELQTPLTWVNDYKKPISEAQDKKLSGIPEIAGLKNTLIDAQKQAVDATLEAKAKVIDLAEKVRGTGASIADVVRDHYRNGDGDLASQLVAQAGLDTETAAKLASVIEKGVGKLTDGERANLERILRAAKPKAKPSEVKATIERLLERATKHGFDHEEFSNEVAKLFNVKQFKPEVADEIKKRAEAIQELPEGSRIRAQATTELLDYIRNEHSTGIGEAITSYQTANILFQAGTTIYVPISTAIEANANVMLMALKRPQHAGAIYGAYLRMFSDENFGHVSTAEWKAIMRGDFSSLVGRNGAYNGSASRWTERVVSAYDNGQKPTVRAFGKDFKVPDWLLGKFGIIRGLRYSGRLVAGAHNFFAHSAAEAHAMADAIRVVEAEKTKTEADFNTRLAEVMGYDKATIEAAQAQAHREAIEYGYSPERERLVTLDYVRRARDPVIQERAQRFGERVTSSADPYGVAGWAADALGKMTSHVPILNFAGIKFLRTSSNVLNNMLNWVPVWSAKRLFLGQGKLLLHGRAEKFSRAAPRRGTTEWDIQLGKTVFAHAVVGGVFGMAQAALSNNKDDPTFSVIGNGPANIDLRQEFQRQGGKTDSFKLGRTYVSFKAFPGAAAFHAMGNYFDAMRYGSPSEQSVGALIENLGMSMATLPLSVVNMEMLHGAQDLADIVNGLSHGQDAQLAKKIRNWSENMATSVIPFDPLAHDAERLVAPPLHSGGFMEHFVRSIPVAGEAALNQEIDMFGRPVERSISERIPALRRLGSSESSDPVYQFMVQHGYAIHWPEDQHINATQPDGKIVPRIMTSDEHYHWVSEAGPQIYNTIRDAMPTLEQLPEDQQREQVQRIVRLYQRSAGAAIEDGLATRPKRR
jgi:hypothetical protein